MKTHLGQRLPDLLKRTIRLLELRATSLATTVSLMLGPLFLFQNSTIAAMDDATIAKSPNENNSVAELTPAIIADKIEEVWKRYDSIEYIATIEETRNTNWPANPPKPNLVKGTGRIHYRSDGTRWLVDHQSFSFNIGSKQTYPTQSISSFDGKIHSVLQTQSPPSLTIGVEESIQRFRPSEIFWQGGISTGWLLAALRRPEAKIVDTTKSPETTSIFIESQWKPDWDQKDRKFYITICPELGWSPRRVVIERGGELVAETTLRNIERTATGIHYPTLIQVKRPETDDTPLRTVKLTSFRDRIDFAEADFVNKVPHGFDILDNRLGFGWQNDPWSDELVPWIQEKLRWPEPSFEGLQNLRSTCDPSLFGLPAPVLKPREWLTKQAPQEWDRPERKLTILYFYSGGRYSEAARELKGLDLLFRRYRESGLDVIAFAPTNSSVVKVRQYLEELDISFPVAIDSKADAADIESKRPGAQFGATYKTYQQMTDVGAVLVDQSGKTVEARSGYLRGTSQLEEQLKELLLNPHELPDLATVKQRKIHRASQLFRGTEAGAEELEAPTKDQSPDWLINAQKRIIATMTPEQHEYLKSHRRSVEQALDELNEKQPQLSSLDLSRIEDEWKRRVSMLDGNAVIQGTLKQKDGTPLRGINARIQITPLLRMMQSNSIYAHTVIYDRSRRRSIGPDANGRFEIPKLVKGTYEIKFEAPGYAKTERVIQVATNDSIIEEDVELAIGDQISGVVADEAGVAIKEAIVKAITRHPFPDNPGRTTTADLPSSAMRTDANGQFKFESLYEGDFTFEVTAKGYEKLTTERTPAGSTDVHFVLKADSK